jgi:large subunit ribosomal protein L21
MFAVIKTGGKQYRVAPADLVEVAKLDGEAGDTVSFGDVLAVGGDSPTLGSPLVAGASVAGEIVAQKRTATVLVFKKRRRQNSKRRRGHRQDFTLVKITEILTDGAKPSVKAKAAEAAPEAAASGEEAPAKKPRAKKAKE